MKFTTAALGSTSFINNFEHVMGVHVRSLIGPLALSAALAASPAQAAVIEWDFTGDAVTTGNPTGRITTNVNGANYSYDFIGNDLAGSTLGVSAARLTDAQVNNRGPNATLSSSRVTRNADFGLGVSRSLADNQFDASNNTIDNLGVAADALLFDFGLDHNLVKAFVDFSQIQNNDHATVLLGNGLIGPSDLLNYNFDTLISDLGFTLLDAELSLAANPVYEIDLSGGDRWLLIAAVPQTLQGIPNNLDNDNFRISGISAQVPTPATLALFGLGLLGLGLARRTVKA